MNGKRNALLSPLQAGMEMSWLHPTTAFVSSATIGSGLSFGNALIVFVAGGAAAFLSLGKGWRVFGVLIVHLIGLSLVAAGVLYVTYHGSYPFFSWGWLRAAFYNPRPDVQWVALVILLLSILLFWICGALWARRRMTYLSVCSRFDVGLTFLFLICLTKLVVLYKGGGSVGGGTLYPLFSFLVLSLVAISTARAGGAGAKSFLAGHGPTGVVASFSAVVFLTAGAVILFFLPLLQTSADAVYAVVSGGGRFVAPFLIGAVRFLFAPRSIRPDPPSPAVPSKGIGSEPSAAGDAWWAEYFRIAIEWGIKALVATILLFAAAVVLYALVRWLLARTGKVDRRTRLPRGFPRLWDVLSSFVERALSRIRGYERAADLYDSLLSWGRRSGVPREASDTPSEFAILLSVHFPLLEPAIHRIVTSFNREVYGGLVTTPAQLSVARSDLRSLRHPRHWPRRLRVRLSRKAP